MAGYQPFVGLRSYEAEDAGRFFGREREAREITTLIHANRLTVVYGRSGVGKTSLINAGVLAGIDDSDAQVLPPARLPRVTALQRPSMDGNPFVSAIIAAWASGSQGIDLSPTLAEQLRRVPERSNDYDEPLPLIVVIDQFEEAFGDHTDWAEHRVALLEQVGRAAEDVGRLRLVLLMKEDAVGQMLLHERMLSGGWRGGRYRVESLQRAAALRAVAGPLGPTGRKFAPGAAELLVDRLRTNTLTNAAGERKQVESATVEPIFLQVACTSLWEALPDDATVITHDHIRDHASVESALQDFCVEAVSQVSAREAVPEPALWEWLARYFITSTGTRDTTPEGMYSVGGMPKGVARGLEDRRILTSERRSGTVQFELSHDGLVEAVHAQSRQRAAGGNGGDRAQHAAQYRRLATTALADQLLVAAEEFARSAVDVSEDEPVEHAESWVLLGNITWRRAEGRPGSLADSLYDTSVRSFEHAVAMLHLVGDDRGVGRVLGQLGQLFYERARTADALDVLRQAVSRVPDDVNLRLALARTLRQVSQFRAALREYEQVLAVQPGHREAQAGREWILTERVGA